MAITSDLIGRIDGGGGGEETVTPKNIVVSRNAGFIDLGEITVEKSSTIVVEVSHNNTNSFRSTSGGAVVAIWPKGQERTAENCRYGANYESSISALHPLEVSMRVTEGTYSIAAVLNASLSSYTVTSLRTLVVPE